MKTDFNQDVDTQPNEPKPRSSFPLFRWGSVSDLERSTSDIGRSIRTVSSKTSRISEDIFAFFRKIKIVKTKALCQMCANEIHPADNIVPVLSKIKEIVYFEEERLMQSKRQYDCRVCDFKSNIELEMKIHLTNHIKSNEIDYCLKCQEWINDLESNFANECQRCSGESDVGLEEKPKRRKSERLEPTVHVQVASRISSYFSSFSNKCSCSGKSRKRTFDLKHSSLSSNADFEYSGSQFELEEQHKNRKKHSATSRIHQFWMRCLHKDSEKLEESLDSSGSFPQRSFACAKCEKEIIFQQPLANVLLKIVKPMQQRKQPSAKKSKEFCCLVCGLKNTRLASAKAHIAAHFYNNDILYCIECQKAINKISLGVVSDLEDTGLLNQASANEPVLLGRTNVLGLKNVLVETSVIPLCGGCRRVFDYLVPLIHKAIELHLFIAFNSDKVVSKRYCFYCCLCFTKEVYRSAIERHVLDHIENEEIICKECQEKENHRNAGNSGKVNASRTNGEWCIIENLSSLREEYLPLSSDSISEDGEANGRETNMFRAFLLTVENNEFNWDEDILEVIKSSDWKFTFTSPQIRSTNSTTD